MYGEWMAQPRRINSGSHILELARTIMDGVISHSIPSCRAVTIGSRHGGGPGSDGVVCLFRNHNRTRVIRDLFCRDEREDRCFYQYT
jgi:hypothetical protein